MGGNVNCRVGSPKLRARTRADLKPQELSLSLGFGPRTRRRDLQAS
jgi:hypothetical protein